MPVEITVPVSITKIHQKSDSHPGEKYQPAIRRDLHHQVQTKKNPHHRDKRKFLQETQNSQHNGSGNKQEKKNFLISVMAYVHNGIGDALVEGHNERDNNQGSSKLPILVRKREAAGLLIHPGKQ